MKAFFFSLAISLSTAAFAGSPLEITQNRTIESLSGFDATVSGSAEVHVTSADGLDGASVNLVGADAWLYLDNITPSLLLGRYIAGDNPAIRVDGAPADVATNVRIAQYRGGSVVIPHGVETFSKALTVYDKTFCEGNSKEVAVETYYNDLGDFDNNIRSFRLKKGYQLCLANNPDGTGHSRVYIADKEDLTVNVLPDGFVTKDGSDRSFVSFIRVVKHQWVSKKGWCGWNSDINALVGATHTMSWSAERPSDAETIDREFTPQRHHSGSSAFETINRQTNVSHLLADNEPDAENDCDLPVPPISIVRSWQEYMKCGLRVGSPASANVWNNWLSDFFALCDSLNYRVDFAVFHQLEPTTDFSSRVARAVEVSNGRPVWITEWNNGANWTNEAWHDARGPKRDADCNIIYYRLDENGMETVCSADDEGAYEKEVARPLSPENAEKQLDYIKTALQNQDAIEKLERTNFYNSVQDARAVELGGRLTPAGKYFAGYNAQLAYNESAAYEHLWQIAPPLPEIGYSDDYKSARLSWYDHNGETGLGYIIWKRKWSDTRFQEIGRVLLGTDYEAGGTVTFEDPITSDGTITYRVQAISYRQEKSGNSREVYVTRDHVAGAPEFTIEAESPYSATLSIYVREGTRAVLIERRDAEDADFRAIGNPVPVSDLEYSVNYTDNDLREGRDYWYRVSALSSSEETPVSAVVKTHTPSMNEAPEAVYDLFAASGDGKVTLSWSKTYYTSWSLERAHASDGVFETIAFNITALKYTDTSVENGKSYLYRLVPQRFGMIGEPSEPVEANPRSGNVVYVPFAEGFGSEARDHYSRNDVTLPYEMSWTDDRFGNKWQAVDSFNDWGRLAVSGSPLANADDYSVSVWFKRNNSASAGRIFDFSCDEETFICLDCGFENTDGFLFRAKGAGTDFIVEWDYPVRDLQWHHVSLIRESGEITLYLDGEKIGTESGYIHPQGIEGTNKNYLGSSRDFNEAHGDFSFDDLFIHSVALDQEGVKKAMNTSVLGVEDIPVGGDGGAGVTVSGRGNEIWIVSDAERTLGIYSADGRLVRTVRVAEGSSVFSGFAPGVYIIAGSKILVAG